MLKSCKYCGRIHDRKFDCGRKPKRKAKRFENESGRYTYAWQKKSREIKERSQYLCAYCFAHGVVNYNELETHHIIKLKDRPDLLLEDENLICLCNKHHREADDGKIPVSELKYLVCLRDDIPPTPDIVYF